jgi:serine phosphatase RsbU (regulator of sigma subunit)/type II secretory pathway component PulM
MKAISIFCLCFFLCLLSCVGLQAQDVLLNGIVKDLTNKPLQGVKITINEVLEITSNAKGEFAFMLHKNTAPEKVVAEFKGMRKQRHDYISETKVLEIYMTNEPLLLRGRLVDGNDKPLGATKITVDGIDKPSFIMTDADGKFRLSLPADKKPTDIGYIIGNNLVPLDHILFDEVKNMVTITTTKKMNPNNQMVMVLVEDELGNSVPDVVVKVNGKTYKTNKNGEFQIQRSLLQAEPNKPFPETTATDVEGFQILRRNFDENDIFLLIKTGASLPVSDSLYQEDLGTVINELEMEKQVLAQKGGQIQVEIEKVTEKLAKQENFTEQQRLSLFKYLEQLKNTLVANEIAYEEAQDKTKKVIENMRKVLIEKDSRFEESQKIIDEKTQIIIQEEKYLLLASILAFVMLITAIGFFLFARRIRRQKNKISKQRDEIEQQKNEIHHAYENIKTISNIGQEITALLDINMLVQVLHKHVSSLMDASVFGVGIPNEKNGKIEFKNFVDNNTIIAYHAENLADANKFSVWCHTNIKPVIINDLAVDYKKYIAPTNFVVDETTPKSLIYLPLQYENQNLGVLTVQSRKYNAYEEIEIQILQALASYVAVALANSNSYKVIKDTNDILEVKNRNITDSIRYAQTIQQTILPSERELQAALNDYFVLYLPKDIVSGDFYWLANLGGEDIFDSNKIFTAVVDCTGHGVPGAFMSMVGSNILNEIVKIRREYQPAKILSLLDMAIIEALKQDDKVNNDGMDICLCLIETHETSTKITFAGTRRPLYYIKDGVFDELRGDRVSIGGIHQKQGKNKEFTDKELVLQNGDMIFLTTDGIADQNNIDKQKFSTQRLKDGLTGNAKQPVRQQKSLLQQDLQNFMKGVEQRDDITVMGIKM